MRIKPFSRKVQDHATRARYVNEGLRAAKTFGQSQQAVFNTAIITALGLASIAIGSHDQMGRRRALVRFIESLSIELAT